MAIGRPRLIVDLGTGDGRAALALARAQPDSLVLGLDTSAIAMARVSRQAARRAERGGAANLLFVVGSAERPPPELAGRVDLVTVNFPWGSLARAVLGLDDGALAGIAGWLRAGAHIEVLTSLADRDRHGLKVGPEASLDSTTLSAAWRRAGLALSRLGPAEPTAVLTSGSTWARRLRIDPDRPMLRISGRRNANRS